MATVFFDLDGVLADFVAGALAHHGRSDFPYTEIRWGIEEQLGIAPEAFWAGLGFTFWESLPLYPDGLCLLRSAEKLVGADNIALLTSPCDTAGCTDGKRAWVAKHLPDYRKRLFVGSAKHMFAGPGKVLVDDHDPNVEAFSKAGGRVVQPPRPWNRHGAQCFANGHFHVPDVFTTLSGAVYEANRRPRAA